jgi:hypothetical protein
VRVGLLSIHGECIGEHLIARDYVVVDKHCEYRLEGGKRASDGEDGDDVEEGVS